jgi:hypothetical protein
MRPKRIAYIRFFIHDSPSTSFFMRELRLYASTMINHQAAFSPKSPEGNRPPADLQGNGRFYSWKYLLRHLARLDFHYAAIRIFGKTAVHKFLKPSPPILLTAASTLVRRRPSGAFSFRTQQ